jgi:putative transposase
MLRVLKGKRSPFYEWRHRSREPDHPLVRVAIHEAHEVSERTYGVRRVVPELRSQGFACGKKLVARLMREEGLQGLLRRTKPYGRQSKPRSRPSRTIWIVNFWCSRRTRCG